MGRLTTHVLDTTHGRPGQGIAIELSRVDGNARRLIKQVKTNSDGRCDSPLLDGDELKVGVYELLFSVGAYFSDLETATAGSDKLASPRFLDDVVIRFGVSAADEHYHVPLLISPFSYSTYRGS